MNRRNFFKVLIGVIATVAIAPKALLGAEAPQKSITPAPWVPLRPVSMRPFSDMDFINRKRMILSIEKQLEYFIFELNDARTQRQVCYQLTEYLEFAKMNRAILEYRVICDESNNSPAVVDRNELHASVCIKEKIASFNWYKIDCVVSSRPITSRMTQL